MYLPELSCVSGFILIMGLVLGAIMIVVAIPVSQDIGIGKATFTVITMGLSVIAASLVVALIIERFVLDRLVLSIGIMLGGGFLIWVGSTEDYISPPRGWRGRSLYNLANAVGGMIGVKILYVFSGVILILLGLLGLMAYFNLV
jgi:hypothetical protein